MNELQEPVPDTQEVDIPDARWVIAAVERYERPLAQYTARLVGGDEDLARDVVQDAFLKLWRADRAKVNGHLAQWLYRVCRNRALDIVRKDSRMTRLDDMETTAAVRPTDDSERSSRDETVCGAMAMMATLPARDQEILRLKFQGGLSYKEIATVMDLTVSHVGVLIHTALKTIREKLNAGSATDAGHVR